VRAKGQGLVDTGVLQRVDQLFDRRGELQARFEPFDPPIPIFENDGSSDRVARLWQCISASANYDSLDA
jgi:hypothetical protein